MASAGRMVVQYQPSHFHTVQSLEVMFGQPPPIYLPYFPGESKVEVIDRSLQKREEALKLVKFHMKRAQERMKQLADKKRSDRSYEIGDIVYVKLHPYKQISVAFRPNAKLAPKYFGPFQMKDKIGAVAYRLKLLQGSKIHDVFHVSQLKRHVGEAPVSNFLPTDFDGVMGGNEPKLILDRATIKRGNRAVTKVLVKWKH